MTSDELKLFYSDPHRQPVIGLDFDTDIAPALADSATVSVVEADSVDELVGQLSAAPYRKAAVELSLRPNFLLTVADMSRITAKFAGGDLVFGLSKNPNQTANIKLYSLICQ